MVVVPITLFTRSLAAYWMSANQLPTTFLERRSKATTLSGCLRCLETSAELSRKKKLYRDAKDGRLVGKAERRVLTAARVNIRSPYVTGGHAIRVLHDQGRRLQHCFCGTHEGRKRCGNCSSTWHTTLLQSRTHVIFQHSPNRPLVR